MPHGGYERTPEIRSMQSRANTRAWQDPEIRRKYLEVFANRPPNPDTMELMHTALAKLRQDPEWVEAFLQNCRHPHSKYTIANPEENSRIRSECLKGRIFTEEHRRRLSEAGRRRLPPSLEQRQRQSRTMKRKWANPEYARRVSALHNRRPNRAELKLLSILDSCFPNEWKYVGDGQVWINGRNPDFINVNGKKQVIELFSHYWHIERARTVDDEQDRVNCYKEYGFDCFIIWASQLTEKEVLRCLH